MFGLPGGHTLPIYDGLYHTEEIRHILVRHEQSAASMAAAYAMLTGEPGVCCATAGPGATNLITGIVEAYVGCLPVIVLAGRGVTRNALRGASQEIPQDKIFAPITKWSVRVDQARYDRGGRESRLRHSQVGKAGPRRLSIFRRTCSPRQSSSKSMCPWGSRRGPGETWSLSGAP